MHSKDKNHIFNDAFNTFLFTVYFHMTKAHTDKKGSPLLAYFSN